MKDSRIPGSQSASKPSQSIKCQALTFWVSSEDLADYLPSWQGCQSCALSSCTIGFPARAWGLAVGFSEVTHSIPPAVSPQCVCSDSNAVVLALPSALQASVPDGSHGFLLYCKQLSLLLWVLGQKYTFEMQIRFNFIFSFPH